MIWVGLVFRFSDRLSHLPHPQTYRLLESARSVLVWIYDHHILEREILYYQVWLGTHKNVQLSMDHLRSLEQS